LGVGLAKVFIQGSFEKKKNNIYISHHLQRTKEERDTETLWMHTQVELKKKVRPKSSLIILGLLTNLNIYIQSFFQLPNWQILSAFSSLNH